MIFVNQWKPSLFLLVSHEITIYIIKIKYE